MMPLPARGAASTLCSAVAKTCHGGGVCCLGHGVEDKNSVGIVRKPIDKAVQCKNAAGPLVTAITEFCDAR